MVTPPTSQCDSNVAELHGEDVAPPDNLWQLFKGCVEQNPEGVSVIACHQTDEHLSVLRPRSKRGKTSYASWTFKELQEGAELLAAHLSSLGLGKGSKVTLFIYNSLEWPLFLWALARLGAVFIPLDPRFLMRTEELSHFMNFVQPDAVVLWNASDAVTFEAKLKSTISQPKVKLICEGTHNIEQGTIAWRNLSELLNNRPKDLNMPEPSIQDIQPDDIAVMMATSGSTNIPKLCPHTARSLGSCSSIYRDVRGLGPKQKYLVHSPSFHIMGAFALLCSWRGGAAGVFPSRQFDAGATLRCLKDHGCTHFSVTPSMTHALISHPLFESCRPDKVELISVGAEIIPPEIMDLCRDEFRAKTVVATWGMTEGVGVVYSGLGDVPPVVRGAVSIGRLMSGGRIRICDEGETKPLARNQEGELHCSGSSMIQQYWNDKENIAFYTDKYGKWLITGDRAYIDEDGNVFVTGRSKDLIIRGGENISPAVIEACLNGFTGITSQVIGIRDPIVGEVPVAVIKIKPRAGITQDIAILKSKLRQRVVHELGTTFSLSDVFMIDELGITEFPLVSSGKVRKSELRDLVKKHVAHQNQKISASTPEASLRNAVLEIWSDLLGLDGIGLDTHQPVVHLADSLTIMRFCHRVETSFHKRFSPADTTEHDTIEKQITFLSGQTRSTVAERTLDTAKFTSPSLEDIALVQGNSQLFHKLQQSVEPALDALGLSWEHDVQTIHRMTEACVFWMKKSRTPSSNVRSFYELTDMSLGFSELHQALKQALGRHDCLRTIFSESTIGPVQLVLKPNDRFFGICINEEVIDVNTTSDLTELVRDLELEFAGPPLPFYLVRFVRIQETGRIGLLQSIHHAVFDATSLGMFYEDFDGLLQASKKELQSRVPFKLFADTYYLHAESIAAKNSIQYHVRRFQGIGTMGKAFWPKSRVNDWITGTDHGWINANGSKSEQDRPSFDRAENRIKGTILDHENVRLTTLETLKIKHSIEAPTLVQAAIALFNTEVTGEYEAYFSNTLAARHWPFLQAWITDRLPNPMSIAGPTMERSINVIHIDANETTLAFLQRLQREQNEDMQHLHVPYSSVVQQLGIDGDLLDSLVRRQTFNWVHNKRKTHSQTLKVLKRVVGKAFMDFGFTWEFGLSEPGVIVGRCSYDDAHLKYEEVRQALDRVFELLEWLSVKENWETKVGNRPLPSATALNGFHG